MLIEQGFFEEFKFKSKAEPVSSVYEDEPDKPAILHDKPWA